jgi:hypothetical protein
VALRRSIDGAEPLRPEPIGRVSGMHEERRSAGRARRLARGTLACPRCDAPVAPAAGATPLTDELDCPFCRHAAPARDFVSLAAPSRPARVDIMVVERARPVPAR